MADNKHELRLWWTKPLVLAGNTQLIGNCVENSCKLPTTGMHLLSETDMCSILDFLGGNKQTNKTKTSYFIISFQMACWFLSYCVWSNDL